MPRDTELDRLKGEKDLAFERKQRAHQDMQHAWERRTAVKEKLDSAHEEKRAAYEAQNEWWQYLQHLRDQNGPRIDALNEQQERAFENMKDAFERASSAYESRDGASASSYAYDGRRYKQEAKDCTAERQRLVRELREARGHHDTTRSNLRYAKSQFDQIKRDYDTVKAEHERKQEAFRRAKSEFDEAVQAFKSRLETVRAESHQRRQDKRNIAERAGVPHMYLDNIWISHQRDGTVNIYFGGVDRPNGPGHGHYVLKADGTVTYRREPFDPHGSQNFTDQPTQDWHDGMLDGSPARVRQTGNRIEALWGGSHNNQPGDGHGHIASNDGVNVDHLRLPGGKVIVDNRDDNSDPYVERNEGWH